MLLVPGPRVFPVPAIIDGCLDDLFFGVHDVREGEWGETPFPVSDRAFSRFFPAPVDNSVKALIFGNPAAVDKLSTGGDLVPTQSMPAPPTIFPEQTDP